MNQHSHDDSDRPEGHSKHNEEGDQSKISLLVLPDELLLVVLTHLYFDIFEDHGWHNANCASSGKLFQRCECPVQNEQSWFWYSLPLVHTRIFALLPPAAMDRVEIPDSMRFSREAEEKITYMACPAVTSVLAQTRVLRIDHIALAARFPSGTWSNVIVGRVLPYLAHIYLICLSAKKVRTLELIDLQLGKGASSLFKSDAVPFHLFEDIKPIQYDLTCSRLVKQIPAIFDALHHSMPPEQRDRWNPAAARLLCQQINHIVGRPDFGFSDLQDVYLVDSQSDTTLDDYANLFLHSRALEPSERCDVGQDCCRCISLCPSLSSLTIVSWHQGIEMDEPFLRAMVHIAQHHPDLKELKLISRELRFDRRLFGRSASLEWRFEEHVAPRFQLAQELLCSKLKVTIYLLTSPAEEAEMHALVERHKDAYPGLTIAALIAGEDRYSGDPFNFDYAAYTLPDVHRQAYRHVFCSQHR